MVRFGESKADHSIILKSPREIEAMRETANRLKLLMKDLVAAVKPGVTAKDIDNLAAKRCRELDVKSGAYGYGSGRNRFPGYICVSINEVIVHGIPGPRRIEEGDIVSLDVAVSHKGYFSDNCTTIAVGEVSKDKQKVMAVCRDALFEGIAQARAGNHLSDISHAIEKHADKHGLHVVRDFVGHGIGRAMHEPPAVPHYGPPGRGLVLRPGMVICIEPQLTVGSPAVEFLPDGWTAVTADRSMSAHFEHTVAITTNGPDILTAGAWE